MSLAQEEDTACSDWERAAIKTRAVVSDAPTTPSERFMLKISPLCALPKIPCQETRKDGEG